jgi:ketosteroid isomerase-like protein
MSNVELVRQFYDLFKARDKGYLNLCSDDIEWNTMEGMPSGGRYMGKQAVFELYFPSMLSNFAEFHAITGEFIDAGNVVIVLGKYKGVAKNTGKKFEAPFAHVYKIKEGRIASFRQYADTAKIQQALG